MVSRMLSTKLKSTRLYYVVLYNFYDLKNGIRNLIRWLPVIWKDRDWDYAYIEDLMLAKLDHMIKYYGSINRYVDQERDLDRMITTKKLLQAVRDESYLDLEPWLKQEISIDEKKRLQVRTVEDNLGEYYDLYPRIYTEVVLDLSNKNKELERERIAIHMAHRNHNRARDLAYKLIATYSPSWWI